MLRNIRRQYRQSFLVGLCQLLLLQTAFGQQTRGEGGLRIQIVDGEGAQNVVLQIAPKPLVVRVVDASNRPVAGAAVVFTAPESGPSGRFSNDLRTVTATTGPDGLARAGTYHPNEVIGPYQIRVTAEIPEAAALAVISQVNLAERKGHGKLIAILAVAGGAAAAAVVYHNKNSGSNNISIGFGGAAVGAPK
jgi:hypothetical protein